MTRPVPSLLGDDPEGEEARETAWMFAEVAAELLVGSALRTRALTQEVYLGGTSERVLLDHYPVREVRIEGKESPRGFYVDEGCGIVYADRVVPASSYRVDFLVGQEPRDVPAIHSMLVEQVAEWILNGEGDPAGMLDVGQAATGLVELAREERATCRRRMV